MHNHRRRKKRPNYGIRTLDVSRGLNGFGFTISGQKPCILSCIVANSPSDRIGLRAGDFLISVNELNVSKLPHEDVVQLIGNSTGTIRMSIAENYYSDSSDEGNFINQSQLKARPKYPNNKVKINRGRVHSSDNSKKNESSKAHNVIHSPNASNKKDISNVSAMVRCDEPGGSNLGLQQQNQSLEYRTVVGYLGTIEMPKQIATSSKLQTVRSCIRKMRQEKRNPITVLMTILPTSLTLRNNNNTILANYSASRLNYVSSSSESDNKFFGLVTSAIFYADGQMMIEPSELIPHRNDVVISNSCHVFVIDAKLVEHSSHLERANEFQIDCTKDPISNTCLEFPNNSEYVVNLIRSMYTLKSAVKIGDDDFVEKPRAVRNLNMEQPRNRPIMANSPQPSNHSEITTTSSNSDSGIGFHNDCTNISDRILVVDFPGLRPAGQMRLRAINPLLNPRPVGIINEIPDSIRNIRSKLDPERLIPCHSKSKSADLTLLPSVLKATESRLTVRAMPDRKLSVKNEVKESHYETEHWYSGRTIDLDGNLVQERPVDVPKFEQPDLLFNSLLAARSCDDMMMTFERESTKILQNKKQMSIDDITMLGEPPKPPSDEHIFLPPKPLKKMKKQQKTPEKKSNKTDDMLSYKLSPKVFGMPRPIAASFENLSINRKNDEDFSNWGSLQELRGSIAVNKPTQNYLEGTYSEPDLRIDEVSGFFCCFLYFIFVFYLFVFFCLLNETRKIQVLPEVCWRVLLFKTTFLSFYDYFYCLWLS